MPGYIYRGSWLDIEKLYRCQGGSSWQEIHSAYVYRNGSWLQWFPGGDTGPPPGGQVVLSPTSLSLGTLSGYAEFATGPYRGSITGIWARISWRSGISTGSVDVSGRPSGTYYRNIGGLSEWAGRTIDHRIDTFNATSLSQFNSGSAYGFNLASNLVTISGSILNVQLVLEV